MQSIHALRASLYMRHESSRIKAKRESIIHFLCFVCAANRNECAEDCFHADMRVVWPWRKWLICSACHRFVQRTYRMHKLPSSYSLSSTWTRIYTVYTRLACQLSFNSNMFAWKLVAHAGSELCTRNNFYHIFCFALHSADRLFDVKIEIHT